MAVFKTYLKFKLPQNDNIMGLSLERYEVLSCEYDFQQTINSVGEPNSRVKGGLIELVISTLPSKSLMAWVFDHAKKYNGEITLIDTIGETVEQTYFENARCIDFNLIYKATDKTHSSTKLTLAVEKIYIGETCFDNLKR